MLHNVFEQKDRIERTAGDTNINQWASFLFDLHLRFVKVFYEFSDVRQMLMSEFWIYLPRKK